MIEVKVLGSGCTKCTKTAELIQAVADENQITVQVTKETDPETIMKYGVMSTPGIVVDEKLVHSGSIPDKATIETWLKSSN